MEFLMSDGTVHTFTNVLTAEVEDGALVGRSRSGEFILAFAVNEVLACGESLQVKEVSDGNRREGGRRSA
jgi:hypothetical protein